MEFMRLLSATLVLWREQETNVDELPKTKHLVEADPTPQETWRGPRGGLRNICMCNSLDSFMEDGGLSAFMPKTLGNRDHKEKEKVKQKENAPPVQADNGALEDDEYEIEAPVGNDSMMAMLPMSFGKQDGKRDLASSFAKTKRVPDALPATRAAVDQADESSDDSEDMIGPMPAESPDPDAEETEDEGEDDDEFPVSHEIILKDHTKAVSAISLDPSGSRLFSGSYDYDFKLWDFGGMNAALKPFKTVEPVEGHPIHHLEYSISGDSILVITSSLQPKLYSREGLQLTEFTKGDMYLRDMRHTKGHVAEVTSAAWNPQNRDEFISASADSTVRIWDVNNKWEHKTLMVVKGKGTGMGQRTKITVCAYSSNGKWIGGAATDGTVNLWGANGPYTRPSASVDGHVPLTETSGMTFSQDGNYLVTRGGDETVKVWDTRNFKAPVAQRHNIENNFAQTNIMYTPNMKYLLTGQSCPPDEQGNLLVLDAQTLSTVRVIQIDKSSVIRVLWNTRINQIVTGSHNGSIHVLYSPTASLRGAKLIVTRAPKTRHIDDDSSLTIDVPEGYSGDQAARLEDGKGERLMRKLKAQHKANTQATRPEMPNSAVASDPDKDHVRQQYGLSAMRTEDPREALLKFAEKAKNDPIFTKAYLKNQPKPLLEERAGEDIVEPAAKRRK